MKKVKVALIGYGHLGKWHAEKAAKLSESDFIGIVDPSEVARNRAKESFPELKVVSSLDEIKDSIDAVIISSPTSFHYEISKEAINLGLHVFCEKPLCENMEQVESLESLLKEKSDLKFQVGHSERFHQAWELIKDKEVLKEKELLIKVNRFAPFKGRATDVDVVQDLMVHDLDILFYLLNETPVSIEAFGKKIRTDKWDHVMANFTFASGHQATITVGRNHAIERREIEFIGENGCLFVDLFKNTIFEAPKSQVSENVFVSQSDYEKRDHLLIEQELFYQAIQNDSSIFVDFEAGKNAVQFIQLVLESVESRKRINL